ncbi:DUF4129 domain-containing protein [Saccharothrix variisporea]|uniref:Uncharacterized protein DUF4129 n=1 Tax=Saccharothrix variisporea TaxID=543527 RepID=A0A495XDT4_9PSEU|nr:DUF4129 domain-containing protein [Saccharothrix variisporea]RKT70763.1 uncharacterized protein DUF4129 [Saccharothrix variisporea]
MRPRLVLALLVGLALVVVALAARGASPVPYDAIGSVPDTAPVFTKTPADVAEDAENGSVVGGSLVVVAVVLVAMVVIALAGLVLSLGLPRWRRRREAAVGVVADAVDGADGRAPELLVQGAREALEGLSERVGGPPRDAVVGAWLRLEEAAAGSGAARLPHQTPTEFTGALLARYRVDEQATGALRKVYQRARFGTADVTEDDARTAREALEHIVRDLDGSRA